MTLDETKERSPITDGRRSDLPKEVPSQSSVGFHTSLKSGLFVCLKKR